MLDDMTLRRHFRDVGAYLPATIKVVSGVTPIQRTELPSVSVHGVYCCVSGDFEIRRYRGYWEISGPIPVAVAASLWGATKDGRQVWRGVLRAMYRDQDLDPSQHCVRGIVARYIATKTAGLIKLLRLLSQ